MGRVWTWEGQGVDGLGQWRGRWVDRVGIVEGQVGW